MAEQGVLSSAAAEKPKAPPQAAGEQRAQQDSEEAPAKHRKPKVETGEDDGPVPKKLKVKGKKGKKSEGKSQEEKSQAGALHLEACTHRVPVLKTWKYQITLQDAWLISCFLS